MAKKSATYSAKTDTHAEHKHLFGSSGNSDFIVNMTPEGTHKLCGIYSIIAMLLVALSSVPYYISKAVGTGSDYMMLRTENNETLIFLIMTLLIASGFIGMLIFMIACVKREVVIGRNKALLLFALSLVSSVISTIASADRGTAFYGYLDRDEGLVSLVGYLGFFTIGICLTDADWRRRAANTVIGIGTVNAVMGILQSIPALSKWIPSYYNYLFLGYKSSVRVAEYFNAYAAYDASYAADGFTCSPFALAAMLTIASAFAVNKAAHTDKTASRIVCLICTGIMSGAAIVTQTFPAMLGVGCVLLVTLITSAASKSGKTAVITSALALAAAGCIAAGIVLTDNFRMSNEQIIFTDSFERLGIAFNAHTEHDDSIYSALWYDGTLVFKEYPVIGVGPDNWGAMYMNGYGMETDRTYNEVFDTAITRGAIGAVIYLAIIILTFGKACRLLKAACTGKADKAVGIGAFTAFLCFFIQSMFNTTSVCSTPYFYFTIGLIWSYEALNRLFPKKKAEN
ncbi:O-antigen ligase like membrane protein [Ruminococcus sp. YE71]|uniref:O-antigen ligase family protein n=1 Tax=unclassified Ruminococcus TaxID=2608920 RepID=UPI0008822F89|nr:MULTISPECIES: O-antigen ligase family protein [unclassified Ruminococcus]SDA22018.1 O-antigen ligase like membrane protein [Ruminococcus sp. YE78]SFW37290.1 O-antigen ligase like membrane protein [Ruminococcus sp. YE71]